MKLVDSYTEAWKRYVDFGGVTDRPGFWWYVLANFIVGIIFSIISRIIGNNILSYLYSLAVLIPGIAITCRRLRDAGYNPLWILLCLTGIGSLVVLIFTCMPTKNA